MNITTLALCSALIATSLLFGCSKPAGIVDSAYTHCFESGESINKMSVHMELQESGKILTNMNCTTRSGIINIRCNTGSELIAPATECIQEE